jgi:hypothetical protein
LWFEAALVPALTLTAMPALAQSPINTNWRGLAIDGYDSVSYFTEERPVKGSSDFKFEWQGAAWRFEASLQDDTAAATICSKKSRVAFSRGTLIRPLDLVSSRRTSPKKPPQTVSTM